MSQMAAVLRAPGVARLSVGGLMSEVGDWMMFIALPLFVLQLTDSPLVTATVFAVQLLPTVVIGPLAGVLVDRLNPWWLMTLVALGQGAVLLCLLAVDARSDLWLLYAAIAVQAVLSTVIEPCRMVTRFSSRPGRAPALHHHFAGPALERSTTARRPHRRADPRPCRHQRCPADHRRPLRPDRRDLCSPRAAPRRRRRRPRGLLGARRRRRREGPGPTRSGLDRGLQVVAKTPALRRVMAVTACAATAQGAFIVLFVLFVLRDLRGDEADVGGLRGVQAIGALAGGAVLTAFVRRVPTTRLLAISLGAFGALSLCIWNAPLLTSDLALYVVLFIAVGAPGLALTTCLLTLLQAHTHAGARGRVLSTFYAVYGGVQALGMLLAGLVGTGAGLTVALQVQALLYLAGAALALRIASPPAT